MDKKNHVIEKYLFIAWGALGEIVSTYKTMFQQEAGLRVENPVCVSL
jgi:hypothetical protein